jgi:type I restriction enzyme, S subunit
MAIEQFIPEGWIQRSILELCQIGRGRVINQQEITENIGEFPVYSSQTKNNGVMGSIDTYDFDGEFVTWTTDGANAGTVFFRSGKFNCTNVCGTLKEKNNNLDLKFLAYNLSTVAKNHVSYVGNPKLMNGTMSKIILTIPKFKNEQTQIAKVLYKVDESILNIKKLIAKYSRIKTGLMQDLLSQGIDENGMVRSENTHEFKNSLIGRIPKGWNLKTLGQIADFKSGYAFKYAQLTEFGIKIIRISNLHKSNFPFWRYQGNINENWIAVDGDILFTWAGVATSIDCIKYKGEKALLNQHIYNFKFKNDTIKEFTYRYLLYFLPKLRLEIEGGAGQLHLTKDKIKAILIPELDDSEMKLINKKLLKIDYAIIDMEKELKKQRSLKAGLMQDLLTGKVSVSHLLKDKVNV